MSTGTLHQWAFSVTGQADGERLDRFLGAELEPEGISRERIKHAIRDGHALVDGVACSRPSRSLACGQTVELQLEIPAAEPQPEEGHLDIIYRDSHVLVLNKPAGLTVHPAPSCPEGTLVNRLLAHVPELAAMPGMRPGIVHRIDKDTSGLLLVALTESARMRLAEDFALRRVDKTYLAITQGVPVPPKKAPHAARVHSYANDGSGLVREEIPQDDGWTYIDAPIARHPTIKTRMAVQNDGKAAQSSWRVLYADTKKRFALTAVRIHTGRTHQIRVHMAHIGHPLLGDMLYGAKKPTQADTFTPARQMLHAWQLAFTHPVSGERMAFSCPPPADFVQALMHGSQHVHRIILTGSPGCGKSLALSMIHDAGIPTVSADAIVRELYEPGNGGWQMLRAQYGPRFVKSTKGPVDKAALTAALSAEPGLRQEIERLIHPLVNERIEAFFHAAEQANHQLACAEVPLYLETAERLPATPPPGGLSVAGVHCPMAIRRPRLHTRGWSDDLIDTVESWQWPEEKKMRSVDVVLDNSGTPDELRAHIADFLDAVRTRLKKQADAEDARFCALWQKDRAE